MSRYLTEAFKSMNIIDEDVFSVTPDSLKKLDQFLDGDTDVESELIIDPDAETEEDLKDSYVGKVILNCPVCESKIYKDIDSVEIDDESDLVNVDEECPYCQSVGGFEIIGQVEEFKVDDDSDKDMDEGLLDPVKNIAKNLPGVGNLIGESEESDTEMNEGLLDPVKNVAKNIPGVGNLIGESEEEEPIDEGIGGALVGGVLGGAVGGIPGAVAGAAGGHFLQKNLKKEDVSKSRIARRRAKKEGLLDPVKNIASNLPGVGNILGEADETDETNVDEGLLDPVKNVAKNLPGVGNLIGESEESEVEVQEGLLDPVKNVAKNLPGVGNLIGEDASNKRNFIKKSNIEEGAIGTAIGAGTGAAAGGAAGNLAGGVIGKQVGKAAGTLGGAGLGAAIGHAVGGAPGAVIGGTLGGAAGRAVGKVAGKKIGKVAGTAIGGTAGAATGGLAGNAIGNAMKSKKEAIDTENKSIKDISEDASTLAGAGIGATAGALAGAALGSAVPGVGTAIGAGLGTVAGGLIGAGAGKTTSKVNQHIRDKQNAKIIKDIDKADAAVNNLKSKVGLKTEDFKRVNIETDDSIMSMDSDETGKVIVTTEPKAKRSGEMIAPVSDETKDKIIGKNTQPEDDNEVVDLEIDEFDDEASSEVVESYLKRVYENVDSYKITKGKIADNKMIFEGVISFKSGKKSRTSFIFESQTTTKTGKVKFTGQNPQISKNKKAFTLTGRLQNGKIMTESFTYNYLGKDSKTNKSQRVYGTISKRK